MIELTPDNCLDYLRRRGHLGSGPARVVALGWGVSNAVFRVDASDRTFVLKQSRPQLRTRDAWFSDLDRVWREQEVMQVLHPLLPAPVVPEVRFAERDDYLFAMSHAPEPSRVWKESLLAGEVDPAVARLAGTVLGRMHEATGRQPDLVEPFRDPTVFVQLRVDPFYRRIQERRPEVATDIEPLIHDLLTRREALCHGDFSPKNILTHVQGFTLVDYETAHLGDPTMDLGFFLSHLLLKAIRARPHARPYLDLTTAFWESYRAEVTFRPSAELEARAVGHFAACALARIDGTSPVDYLPQEEARQAVRDLTRRVLRERPPLWTNVLAWFPN